MWPNKAKYLTCLRSHLSLALVYSPSGSSGSVYGAQKCESRRFKLTFEINRQRSSGHSHRTHLLSEAGEELNYSALWDNDNTNALLTPKHTHTQTHNSCTSKQGENILKQTPKFVLHLLLPLSGLNTSRILYNLREKISHTGNYYWDPVKPITINCNMPKSSTTAWLNVLIRSWLGNPNWFAMLKTLDGSVHCLNVSMGWGGGGSQCLDSGKKTLRYSDVDMGRTCRLHTD